MGAPFGLVKQYRTTFILSKVGLGKSRGSNRLVGGNESRLEKCDEIRSLNQGVWEHQHHSHEFCIIVEILMSFMRTVEQFLR